MMTADSEDGVDRPRPDDRRLCQPEPIRPASEEPITRGELAKIFNDEATYWLGTSDAYTPGTFAYLAIALLVRLRRAVLPEIGDTGSPASYPSDDGVEDVEGADHG